MVRRRHLHSMPRSLVETVDTVDSRDLCAVITAALQAKPVDEAALRRGVWTYVDAEHTIGTSPGRVIVALTELVERAEILPIAVHHDLVRRVVLWCVEAYFGHLGGDLPRANATTRAQGPSLVSD
jgi:hypothetical protein